MLFGHGAVRFCQKSMPAPISRCFDQKPRSVWTIRVVENQTGLERPVHPRDIIRIDRATRVPEVPGRPASRKVELATHTLRLGPRGSTGFDTSPEKSSRYAAPAWGPDVTGTHLPVRFESSHVVISRTSSSTTTNEEQRRIALRRSLTWTFTPTVALKLGIEAPSKASPGRTAPAQPPDVSVVTDPRGRAPACGAEAFLRRASAAGGTRSSAAAGDASTTFALAEHSCDAIPVGAMANNRTPQAPDAIDDGADLGKDAT